MHTSLFERILLGVIFTLLGLSIVVGLTIILGFMLTAMTLVAPLFFLLFFNEVLGFLPTPAAEFFELCLINFEGQWVGKNPLIFPPALAGGALVAGAILIQFRKDWQTDDKIRASEKTLALAEEEMLYMDLLNKPGLFRFTPE